MICDLCWEGLEDGDHYGLTTVVVEEIVEKRDIRANFLAARKKQNLRRKRGYGRLPSSLRR